jgi:hypothetical protein
MADWGDLTDYRLSPADAAVKYALDMIQRNPNLRYFAGHGTQLFLLLCKAEASRLGVPWIEVVDSRLVPFDHPDAKALPRVAIIEPALMLAHLVMEHVEPNSRHLTLVRQQAADLLSQAKGGGS